jgi:autotransporter translocation and assembly factor TamB
MARRTLAIARAAARWLAIAVIGAVALAVSVYAAVTQTALGREQLRTLALEQLHAALHGRFALRELERVGLDGVALRGLTVRDPAGAQVLAVDSLVVELAPFAALSGEIAVPRVVIAGAQVDLADLGARRGLIAAFAPREPEPAADDRAAQPPRISVRAIELDRVSVRAELADFGRVAVSELALRASFALHGSARAELSALSARLARDGNALGVIESARGRWVERGAPSELALRARLAETALELQASGRMPGDPEFARAPVALTLRADAIDARLLAALGQPAAAEQLRAPVRVALSARGVPDALDTRLQVTAGADSVHIDAWLLDRDRVSLTVRTDGVTPARLWTDAPGQRIALALDASFALAGAPERVPFTLDVTRASLDGSALPELHAQGRIEGERVLDLQLRAHGHGAQLELHGEAGADRVELAGKASARRFAAAGFTAQELDLTFSANGPPAAARVALALRGRELRHGELAIAQLALDARGGPTRYTLALDVEHAEGDVQLQTSLTRGVDAVAVDAEGHGTLRRRPFVLRVHDARIGHAGSVAVREAVVESLGQRVVVHGRYGSSPKDELTLRAHADLAALGRALALEPKLRGEADLTLQARGTLQRPHAQLDVRAHGVGVAERPRFDATAGATLDTRQGLLRGAIQLRSGGDFELATQLAARFGASSREPWLQALRASRLEGTLALGALRSEWLEAWLSEPLPARGTVRADAALAGTLARPELAARVNAQLRHPERPLRAELALDARYAQGRAELALAAHDARGRLVDGRASLEHGGGDLAAFQAPGAALAHEAGWQAALRIEPRALGELPARIELPPELAELAVGMELSASHGAHEEPNAQLALSASRPARPAAAPASGCADQRFDAEVKGTLAQGRARLHAAVRSEKQPLFRADAGAALLLAPALSGRGAPAASDARLTVELAQLEVAALPLVCGLARGRLTGRIAAEQLLGATPLVEIALRGEQLSLGARRGLDLDLRARAAAPEATLDAQLRHGSGRSSISARVPIRRAGAVFEPVQDQPFSARVQLDRLPVAALLPPAGAVSHVSGELSGTIAASGTLATPRAKGELRPQAVALTVTGFAQPLHGIEGRVAFSENRVVIERLTARDRDGTLTVRGHAELRERRDVSAELAIEADEFPLRQQGQVAGELDARIAVKADVTEARTRVGVVLTQASAWVLGGEQRKGIALQAHPDIVDPRAPPAKESQPEQDTSARPLELTLDANDSFWVRRDDFAVKLSSRLAIRVHGEQIRVLGPLRIHRGYLQLLGETFEIDGKSKLEFIGGDTPDPVLDITARTENRRSGKRIAVKIGGRASAPVLEFFIDDVKSTAGDAALAMRGSGDRENAQGEAKSFVAGMLAGVMAMSARRELGDAVPILMLEPQDDLSSTRVRAGFELDSLVPSFLEDVIRGVYVEGIYAGSGGDGSKSSSDVQGGVLLELYLPSDLVTSGEYNTAGSTWSIDLGWEP